MRPRKSKRKYPSITNAPYGKRLIAYLVDLLFIVLIGFFSFAIVDGINANSPATKAAKKEFNDYKFKSGLYFLNSNQEPIYIATDINAYEEVMFDRLEYFYLTPDSGFVYENSMYYDGTKPFDYHTTILKMGEDTSFFTFTTVDGVITYTFKSELTPDQKESKWIELYNYAINDFKENPQYKAFEAPIRQFLILNLTISSFIGAIVPTFLFPLFVGYGRSFGKFITGLAVVTKEGYKPRFINVLLRFLVFGVVETALNFYTFFIPIFLTSGVLTITDNSRALHDLVSNTYVVDARQSRIFNNEKDEEAFYSSTSEEQKENKTFFTEAPLPNNLPLK